MSIDFENLDKYALGYHLHLAFAAMTETLSQELRKAGLNLVHSQFAILRAVHRRPGLNQRELAKETAKDVAAITRSLAYLEKQGLVERKSINGCAKGVFLTAKAESLQPLFEQAIRQTIDEVCANISEGEIESLNRMLMKMKTASSCK